MIDTSSSTSTVSLDDSALTQHLSSLVRHEREHLVVFLRHLAEFDARKLYLGLGFSSLFVYLHDGLKLAKASAYRRFTVARLMTRFPAIAEYLEDGRLNLTRVAKLDDVLTAENHLDVLERASAGSEDDVAVLVATLRPKPDVTDAIRKAPTRAADPAPMARAVSESMTTPPAAQRGSAAELAMAPANPPVPRHAPADASSAEEPTAAERPARMEVEPTSATAYCVRMRVGREFLAEFEEVKAALSHKIPDGNFEDIFRECFRVTLEAIDRRRAAKTRRCGTVTEKNGDASESGESKQERNPAAETKAPSRYIPAPVRRTVWKRDGARCAFVSADGKRCDSRHQLQFHHKVAFASGGASTCDNLSLRCRQHNVYEAELEFGIEFMRAKTARHRSLATEQRVVPPRNSNRARVNSSAEPEPEPAPPETH